MRKLLLSFLCFMFMVNTASAFSPMPLAAGLGALSFYENLSQMKSVFKSVKWLGRDEYYSDSHFNTFAICATPQADIIGMDVDENGEDALILAESDIHSGEVMALIMYFRSDAGNYSGAKIMETILRSAFGTNRYDYRAIADGIDRFFSGEDRVATQIESNGKTLYLVRDFPSSNDKCRIAAFTAIP